MEVWITIAAFLVWFSFPIGAIVSNYLHDNGHIKVKKDEEV